MKKITKLKLCAYALLVICLIILASGIQLEVNPYAPMVWIISHIIIGCLFFAVIFWHLSLNNHIFKKRPGGKKGIIWLGIVLCLTIMSAIAAVLHRFPANIHSVIGALHGKIGFLFILLTIIHTLRHKSFFKKPSKKK